MATYSSDPVFGLVLQMGYCSSIPNSGGIAVLSVIIGLFLLKIMWNLLVPYELTRRRFREDGEPGIPLFTVLELLLLTVAVLTSALTGQQDSFHPWRILVYGLTAILFSYVHLVIVCVLGGWIASFYRRPDKRDEPSK